MGKSPSSKKKMARRDSEPIVAPSSKKRKAPSEGSSSRNSIGSSGSGGVVTKKPKTVWTAEQEALLRTAVAKFGVGKWKEMVGDFDFEGKTGKVLKDKWRAMSRRLSAK